MTDGQGGAPLVLVSNRGPVTYQDDGSVKRGTGEAGAETFGGLGLLLHQAALSFELWTGTPAPLDVMSAAAVLAVAEHG